MMFDGIALLINHLKMIVKTLSKRFFARPYMYIPKSTSFCSNPLICHYFLERYFLENHNFFKISHCQHLSCYSLKERLAERKYSSEHLIAVVYDEVLNVLGGTEQVVM